VTEQAVHSSCVIVRTARLRQEPTRTGTETICVPPAELACRTDDPFVRRGAAYARRICLLERKSPGRIVPLGRFPQLDSLRGLAAALVVVHHFLLMGRSPQAPIVKLSPHGSVSLFFLLSGFVLALPYLKGKQSTYGVFLIRRLIRIYGPYLCGLVLSVIGAGVFHHHAGWGEWADHTWGQPVTESLLFSHLLLIGNYDWSQYNTAFWSLVQEMRVSLCFPILFLVVSRFRILWVLLAALLCSLTYQQIQGAYPGAGSTFVTLTYIPAFVCGILLAQNLGVLTGWYQKLGPSLLILLGIASVALFSEGHLLQETRVRGMWRLGDWPTVLGSAGIVLISLSSPWVRKRLDSSIPTFLGRISYSLYLVHGTVLFTLVALRWGGLPSALHFLVYLATSLLLATGFWFVIDEPAIQVGRAAGKWLQFQGILHGGDAASLVLIQNPSAGSGH
jgi:peptidoglycan/LPS O-acetylase OafA/YrhL